MLEMNRENPGGRHDAHRYGGDCGGACGSVRAACDNGWRAVTSSSVGIPQAGPPNLPAPRRQPQARLRVTPYYEPEGVYPHYNPGPNAVRVCNATYVQEYRPSGAVIVPRMTCYWTR